MSAFHRGYRTFAVHHEKSLVPAFFKVSISDHLFVNLKSGKIKYCFGKSLGALYENRVARESVNQQFWHKLSTTRPAQKQKVKIPS